MMDSITRWCMALREVGLTVGEPPTARGYTPSVFANLQNSWSGQADQTKEALPGIYTVLVEGDDMDEPIADAARGILDGHIVLSRELAQLGHYPAIDVLGSVSRLMPNVIPIEHLELANQIRAILASYRKAEDLINIGAYIEGSNPNIDEAIKYIGKVNVFLKQNVTESIQFDSAVSKMAEIFE